MLKKIIGFVSLLLSGAWWIGIGREFIKTVIFDRILHMLNPDAWPITTIAFQYGPPILLAAIGLYLLARTPAAPVIASPTRESTPVPAPIAEVPKVLSSPTTPPPPITPEKPRRNFVDAGVTPEFLVGLYEEHTALGAAARASKYIGQWMTVSGPLHEVMGGWPILGDRTPAVAALASKGPSVIMAFSGEWIDRVAMLPKNQIISVLGQIEVIERSKIVLENCELVDSDPIIDAPSDKSS